MATAVEHGTAWCCVTPEVLLDAPDTGDPDMEKRGAIHAWRKAGFVETGALGGDCDTTTQVIAFAGKI
jgi:hypothetical protein